MFTQTAGRIKRADMITITRQSRPATFDKTVLLAADEGYFPYAMFCADTIHKLHPVRDFDICIVNAGPLPNHPLVEEIGVRLLDVDMSGIEEALPTGERISVAAYLRFLVVEPLAADYRRILYMDCDTLQLRGNLSELLEADIGNHALAAVRDDAQLRKDRVTDDMAGLGLGRFKYLNSGLLLMDVARFNAARIGARALDLALEQPEKMLLHDQSALNGVLQGDWAELPLVWNFQFWRKTLYFAVHFQPAILHFITSQKPWSSRHGIFPHWILQRYRDFFALHFPQECDRMQGLPAPADRIGTHVFLLLEHAWNFRRFMPNTRRFKDDWDIKL